jgi:hypothetical protein
MIRGHSRTIAHHNDQNGLKKIIRNKRAALSVFKPNALTTFKILRYVSGKSYYQKTPGNSCPTYGNAKISSPSPETSSATPTEYARILFHRYPIRNLALKLLSSKRKMGNRGIDHESTQQDAKDVLSCAGFIMHLSLF